ncbi:MAG: HEPN domain-containing protein [Thermodesulfobacteriota bacterium]
MNEPNREALRWFLQAEDDYRFVKWLNKEGDFFDKGCFCSQQAGEKALKACLYAAGRRRVLGHSLFEMAQELSQSIEQFQEIISVSKMLDRFYITTRYPNGIPGGSPFQVYDKNDLLTAIESLEKIMKTSRDFLDQKQILKK